MVYFPFSVDQGMVEGNGDDVQYDSSDYDYNLPQQYLDNNWLWTNKRSYPHHPFRDQLINAGRLEKRRNRSRRKSKQQKMALKYYPILFA